MFLIKHQGKLCLKFGLRWLDWIFWGGYLPSLSINYVAMSKDMGKRLPQLYYVKMKISFDLIIPSFFFFPFFVLLFSIHINYS